MKKIFSLVLSGMIMCSSFFKASAGGIDREEILSDGTKIIYISTEKISEKLEEFEKKADEIYKKRYSTTQNLAIRGAALSVAVTGIYALEKLGGGSTIAMACQLVIALAGLAGFFYPDYRDSQLGTQMGRLGHDDRPGYEYKFDGSFYGCGNCIHGISCILSDLRHSCGYCDPKCAYFDKKYLDNGIAIIIRPKNKETIDNSFSGLYHQGELHPPGGKQGVYHSLLNAISRGE